MTAGHVAVDLVIQTASGVLTGRFAPREAVTIMASQVPRACGEAAALATGDPDRAQAYVAVLTAMRAALVGEEGRAGDRDLRAVVADLDRLEKALSPSGS